MKLLIPALLSSFVLFAQTAQNQHDWWHDQYPNRPMRSPNGKKLPLISVRGNRFVDPQGTKLLLRGLAISDPDKIEKQGHWNRELFGKVQEMGAKIVRIPVHPVAWRGRGTQKYLTLLDQAVEWSTDAGMYILIDWHSIGNLETELFQDPMYNTTKKETFEFWRTIAARYAGNNTVAFYEFFNEPTTYRDQLGPVTWEQWKKTNEDLIKLIRAYDREKIPLIAGFDWAYDLTPLHNSPIQAAGIGYVVHPYAHKRTKPWEPKWEEDFGFAAGEFPVMATEFGFGTGIAGNNEYGTAIVKYLEGRGISWITWVFDPEWDPALIKSWDTFGYTPSGEFFSKALKGQL